MNRKFGVPTRVIAWNAASMLLAALVVAAFTGSAHAALQNGSFEEGETVSPLILIPWPDAYADSWEGDYAEIITGADQGISPRSGTNMLRFFTADSENTGGPNTSCEMYQLIELPPGTATATLSAWFNKIDFDNETDTQFSVVIIAMEGDPSDYPTKVGIDDWLAIQSEQLIHPVLSAGTWLPNSVSMQLPQGTDYIAVGVTADENVVNDTVKPEFDGHYVDDVTLVLAPALPGPGAWGAVGIILAGLLLARSRAVNTARS